MSADKFMIGTIVFEMMTGKVPVISPAIETIEKPGEDGYILRKVGDRSPPFTVETLGAYPTHAAARNAYQGFANMVGETAGGDPYYFEKDGLEFDTELTTNYGVYVLSTDIVELDKKACIAGTSDQWLLRTKWTLILAPVV